MTTSNDQHDKVKTKSGFIADLDQAGGNTPKTLANNGSGANSSSENLGVPDSNKNCPVCTTTYNSKPGKNIGAAEKRIPRFCQRAVNSIKKIFGSSVPVRDTANNDFQLAIDNLAESVQAFLKKPQQASLAMDAAIRLTDAKAAEREAIANKLNVEASVLQNDLDKAKNSHCYKDDSDY